MRANEMFYLFVTDCRELIELLEEECQSNGSNDNIALLKEYLVKTYLDDDGTLVLPIPFHNVPANDKMKIAVFVTEYLCEVKSTTFKIFKERKNVQTGLIFSKVGMMYKKFTGYILEALE